MCEIAILNDVDFPICCLASATRFSKSIPWNLGS